MEEERLYAVIWQQVNPLTKYGSDCKLIGIYQDKKRAAKVAKSHSKKAIDKMVQVGWGNTTKIKYTFDTETNVWTIDNQRKGKAHQEIKILTKHCDLDESIEPKIEMHYQKNSKNHMVYSHI